MQDKGCITNQIERKSMSVYIELQFELNRKSQLIYFIIFFCVKVISVLIL
jgi:hypothetical protein